MASIDIKGFYRQRKAGGSSGVVKRSCSSSSSKKKNSPSKTVRGRGTATLASPDPVQPAALVSHGSLDLEEDCGKEEAVLRSFDMDMRYGPCLGMTRMERWYRAARMGLDPPSEVENLLLSTSGGNLGQLECLWEGRV